LADAHASARRAGDALYANAALPVQLLHDPLPVPAPSGTLVPAARRHEQRDRRRAAVRQECERLTSVRTVDGVSVRLRHSAARSSAPCITPRRNTTSQPTTPP